MPELPEVETVRQGLAQSITNSSILNVRVLQRQLRQKVPASFVRSIQGKQVTEVARRGKYLLIRLDRGTILWHLGMSGSIWMHERGYTPQLHDHLIMEFDNHLVLRYNDPRRFGLVDYTNRPETHKLLKALGPEPLSADFNAEHLFRLSRKRRCSIKNLIMNSAVVVGVGNIYACESLFHARIRPTRAAYRLTRADCARLTEAIINTLAKAIQQGGTTLRDYVNSEGKPGYFQQQLFVYGRQGENCKICGRALKHLRITNRATVYCPQCQK